LEKEIQMIESIIIGLVALSFIYVSAYIDYEHLRDNDYIESHLSRTTLRGIFIFLIACYNYKLAIGALMLFGALFDQVLNGLRGLPVFHLGSTAKWDIFWSKYLTMYKIVKVLLLIGGLTLFII